MDGFRVARRIEGFGREGVGEALSTLGTQSLGAHRLPRTRRAESRRRRITLMRTGGRRNLSTSGISNEIERRGIEAFEGWREYFEMYQASHVAQAAWGGAQLGGGAQNAGALEA